MIEALKKHIFIKTDPLLVFNNTNLQVWEVEADLKNISTWLPDISVEPQFYFETRDGNEYAGVGVLPLDEPFADFFEKVPSIYFYQKEFNWNPELAQKSWGLSEVVVCPLQFIKTQDRSFVRWIEPLNFDVTFHKNQLSPFPIIKKTEVIPNFNEWMYFFLELKKLWHDLGKIVPARKQTVTLDRSFEFNSFFSKIKNQNHYNFFIRKNKLESFLGSSPERLLRFEQNTLFTEAVAGTRTKEQGSELLMSAKDLKEHQIVVDGIKQSLSPYVSKITHDPQPALVESKNLAHLKTVITAQPNGPQIFDWIDALSPTAAICGSPRALALQTLQKFEPFQRGFYSAPVGVFDKTFADICVAIRSCYLLESQLELYSGVGVIPESDPQLEWNELDIKIKPYLDLLK